MEEALKDRQVFEGGCLCGAIRYRAQTAPTHPTYCHCRMCQQWTGAPVLLGVNFSREGFRFTRGEPAYYQSSPQSRRGFCPTCGSNLCFDDVGNPNQCVTITSLDDPEAVQPEEHIWTSSQLSWFETTDTLPRKPTD